MPADLAALDARAGRDGLTVLGAFHPGPDDGAPAGTGTLVLLGPAPGGFWPVFAASPEGRDGGADPLDRWSARVIGALAAEGHAVAVFPFGGPPHAPFLAWARRTGSAWSSPVGLLVHARLGLFVSYRGALALGSRLALPAAPARPCDGCAAPCLAACPAGALGAGGYSVPACDAWLDTPAGAACLGSGCAVRRACPVCADGQAPAQTRFHMTAFHGRQTGCDA
ncbi:MAG: ferredoxin [Amaricoccus sp.]|uniref:ferredoxin n=1 Tax=Amaricoccus sp. TaxID=1872485 RepID=UPI0039E40127